MSELGLCRSAAGKSRTQILPTASEPPATRTRGRFAPSGQHCGRFFERGVLYAFRDCSSIFASVQPKLPADYAALPGQKQDGIAGSGLGRDFYGRGCRKFIRYRGYLILGHDGKSGATPSTRRTSRSRTVFCLPSTQFTRTDFSTPLASSK